MYKLDSILENQVITKLIAGLKKSPIQMNNPHESDAEIIRLCDQDNYCLAVTTDSISEEISTGLYDDPYLIGWMIVTVNMSDLAAVGASPVGILISEIIPQSFKEQRINRMQKGIADACKSYGTFVLGGDTNEGEQLLLTGTAIGITKQENPLSRIGCKHGDILYSTGKLGRGNANAISKLITQSHPHINYKPIARITERTLLNKYATCCMDTSDGLITTLDQLMRLNDTGFELNADWQRVIDDESLYCAKESSIPAWLLLAGYHGEFELVFTVPRNSNELFLREALMNRFTPIEMGKVIPQRGVKIPLVDKLIKINTAHIRNLSYETNGDVKMYLKLLIEYDLKINSFHLA